MATTQRSRAGRPAAPQSDPATRGLILVVVAVVIGAALLFKGVNDGNDNQAAAPDPQASIAPVPEPDPADTTDTTLAAPATSVAPASLVVAAANSTGQSGVAGKVRTALAAQGYTATKAVNGVGQAATTTVYALEGFEDDAKAVAAALQIAEPAIEALPPSTANLVKEPIPGAQVVVVIGKDSLELPAVTGKPAEPADAAEDDAAGTTPAATD